MTQKGLRDNCKRRSVAKVVGEADREVEEKGEEEGEEKGEDERKEEGEEEREGEGGSWEMEWKGDKAVMQG